MNSGDTIAIVTELCKHGSLESYLQVQARKGAPVPMYRRLQLLSEAAAGLYHLHCHRVVHRDVAARCGVCMCVFGGSTGGIVGSHAWLHCRNLLVTESLHVKVCDFGFGRVLQSSDKVSVSGACVAKGCALTAVLCEGCGCCRLV